MGWRTDEDFQICLIKLTPPCKAFFKPAGKARKGITDYEIDYCNKEKYLCRINYCPIVYLGCDVGQF